MRLSPARAHGLEGVALAHRNAGFSELLPDFFMLALGGEVGFLRKLVGP